MLRALRGEELRVLRVQREGAHRMNRVVEAVVKLGGGVLAYPAHFDAVLAAISSGANERRLLVVPGGGPFAHAVREVDQQLSLSDDAAHWMAVLAMDQYAVLVTSRLAGSVLVTGRDEIVAALDVGRIPVLAPARWLRESDPLPHTWSVTSDSIAAWVAGEVGASTVVLIKPAGAVGDELVDAYFTRALPAQVASVVLRADQIETLHSALRSDGPAQTGSPQERYNRDM